MTTGSREPALQCVLVSRLSSCFCLPVCFCLALRQPSLPRPPPPSTPALPLYLSPLGRHQLITTRAASARASVSIRIVSLAPVGVAVRNFLALQPVLSEASSPSERPGPGRAGLPGNLLPPKSQSASSSSRWNPSARLLLDSDHVRHLHLCHPIKCSHMKVPNLLLLCLC